MKSTYSFNKYTNNIILLRKGRHDKNFTIKFHNMNNLSKRTGNSGGSVFPVARHQKDNPTGQ